MILECSRGHRFDTESISYRDLKEGDRCPVEISYDRMTGLTYCRRVLHELRDEGKERPAGLANSNHLPCATTNML
ncbi:MAG: hypothetical protein PHE15_02860 [Dehalococcoidales bacterium]|nr:hypothetical protein [Dehalococcoidales bacterium]